MIKSFELPEEDYNLLYKLVDDEIDEINDYLVSGYPDETVIRILREQKEKLKNVLNQLKYYEEVTK